MEISPYMLSLLLVYSFIFGISAGVLNDLNRILRIALGMRNVKQDRNKSGARRLCSAMSIVLIAIQDIVLFAYLGVGVAVLNYYLNRGIFRIYSIAATAVGFVLYYFTLGRAVLFFAERIIRALRFVIGWILRIVFAPFRFVCRLLLRAAKKLFEKFRFALAKRKIMRYNKIKREELRALSRCGFATDESFGKGAK